jgi:DNA-binding response OmpR family regulator
MYLHRKRGVIICGFSLQTTKDLANAVTAILEHSGYDVDTVYDGRMLCGTAPQGTMTA